MLMPVKSPICLLMRSAGRLTIDDQKITVNPAGSITVDTANDLSGTTTGVLTATIDPTETVGNLRR